MKSSARPTASAALDASQSSSVPTATRHSSSSIGSAVGAVNASGAAATPTPPSTTDSVIEELKALAKSMLDATNAARRRAHTLESRRSYEALMQAINGRGPAEALTSAGVTPDSSSPALLTAATAPPAVAAPPAVVAQRRGSGPAPSAHVDPTLPTTVGPRVEQAEELSTARGSSQAVVCGNGVGVGAPPVSARVAAVAAVDRVEEPRAAPVSANPPSTPATGNDDDDNVYDGVRTQVLFRSTDAKSHADIAASAWKPERLLRAADGSTVQEKKRKDDDEEGSGSRSSSSSSSSSSVSESAVEGGGAAHGTARDDSPSLAEKPLRVYRVPAFPFGGGVTDAEARQLSQTFAKCIRGTGRGNGGNSAAAAAAAAAAIPRLITKRAFDERAYAEVADTAAARVSAFTPQSPYEFVVEVERPVLFDAVSAREHRRREFGRLVKSGKAPVTMGTFHLRIVMDPIKTGFEDEKNFPIVRGNIIADRYQIAQLLGKATFSRAVRCYDLDQPIYADDDDEVEAGADESREEKSQEDGEQDAGGAVDAPRKKERTIVGYVEVCLKIINNTKDFFDQSLDEIRLLTLINTHRDPDEAHVIRLLDAFYYKEHTMLVTELLSDNLYEYSKYNREEEEEMYFTLPRLRRIARQITEALAYVHSLNLIHADLKPENILFVSHRRCIVKVIDFGSSCFLSDHLSSYIQSRSYRAPEVVLGCDYDGRIDVWSLGAILVELVTGDVLFTSETVPEMLARIVYVCGQPFPRRLLWEGRHTCSFINKFGLIYESSSAKEANAAVEGRTPMDETSNGEEPYYVYTPVPDYPVKGARASTDGEREPYGVLRRKLEAAGMHDEQFFAFVRDCLTLDHKRRPTSAELLVHPFIAEEKL